VRHRRGAVYKEWLPHSARWEPLLMGRQSDKRESESRNGSLRWQRDPKPVVARSLAPSARAESNPSIPVCLNQGGKTSVSNFLPGLLVLAIGGSILRPLLLLTILFLGSRRPLPNAGALALGYFATCAVIGISALVLFGDAGAPSPLSAGSSASRSEACSSSLGPEVCSTLPIRTRPHQGGWSP
jgi:hypothetical protein